MLLNIILVFFLQLLLYVKLSCIWLDSESWDNGYPTWPTNGMLLDVSVSQ